MRPSFAHIGKAFFPSYRVNSANESGSSVLTFPSYWAVNATSVPSGEIWEKHSYPSCAVSRIATPPPAGTFQRSPSDAKTIIPPPIAGYR